LRKTGKAQIRDRMMKPDLARLSALGEEAKVPTNQISLQGIGEDQWLLSGTVTTFSILPVPAIPTD